MDEFFAEHTALVAVVISFAVFVVVLVLVALCAWSPCCRDDEERMDELFAKAKGTSIPNFGWAQALKQKTIRFYQPVNPKTKLDVVQPLSTVPGERGDVLAGGRRVDTRKKTLSDYAKQYDAENPPRGQGGSKKHFKSSLPDVDRADVDESDFALERGFGAKKSTSTSFLETIGMGGREEGSERGLQMADSSSGEDQSGMLAKGFDAAAESWKQLLRLSTSAEEKPIDYCGTLEYSVMYDFTDECLKLKIHNAKELPAKDMSGTSDPYVKILLLPDKKEKMETSVKMKTLNPTWEETFLFEGFSHMKLQKRVLHMMVYDYDRFTRDDPIGEINLPLGEVDFSKPLANICRPLIQVSKDKVFKGELLISLSYNHLTQKVTIVVMKARNLKSMDVSGTSDPYVKIWQLHQRKKLLKKKTNTKYSTLNPVFNESFMFDVPYSVLNDTTFIVTVMDKDRLKWNETIGAIILGRRSGMAEMQHWKEMLAKPRQQIAQWHKLKDLP